MNVLSFTTERGMYDRLDITLLVDGMPIQHLTDPTDTRTDRAISAWLLTNRLSACDSTAGCPQWSRRESGSCRPMPTSDSCEVVNY